MKSILEFIATHKPSNSQYKYYPESKEELIEAIKTELELGNEDLNCIDTSEITDMSYLFSYLYGIDISKYPNIDMSYWDVSNVENMAFMFTGYENFNSDISNWDVSNVKDTACMFYKCTKFNADLSKWNVSKVTNMACMFYKCEKI